MRFKIKEKPSHTVKKIRPPTDEANKKKVADTLTDKIVEKVYPHYRKNYSSKMSNSKWEILLLLAIQSEFSETNEGYRAGKIPTALQNGQRRGPARRLFGVLKGY